MEISESFRQRLLTANYSRKVCLAALHGQAVPRALGDPVHRLCVVRGIRHHASFGTELHGVLPIFTRALNARSIMSNVIPDLSLSEEVPYCIWHPEVASEETYRQLVKQYPHMAYQVGRACAVAGYVKLYKELAILPDVHIAEEARECGNMELFDLLMAQPVRYSIMNDYNLSVDPTNRQSGPLNGDTAVRWTLDVKQAFKDSSATWYEEDGELWQEGLFDEIGFRENLFNITEDMNIDEHDSTKADARVQPNRLEVALLSSPLPYDLPTVQKDLLLVMAAYTGDVDRYARLRRPRFVPNEFNCCIRGIYHSPFFATWWSRRSEPVSSAIRAAINARFIMNNVLSRAQSAKFDAPYLIWWPTIAKVETYRKLAEMQPGMLPQIVHACIYAGYRDLFDELVHRIHPNRVLIRAAAVQRDEHYTSVLEARLASIGTGTLDIESSEEWKRHLMGNLGTSDNTICRYLDVDSIGSGFEIPYDGRQCDGAAVETMAMLPENWLLHEDDEVQCRKLDYLEWPPAV